MVPSVLAVCIFTSFLVFLYTGKLMGKSLLSVLRQRARLLHPEADRIGRFVREKTYS